MLWDEETNSEVGKYSQIYEDLDFLNFELYISSEEISFFKPSLKSKQNASNLLKKITNIDANQVN